MFSRKGEAAKFHPRPGKAMGDRCGRLLSKRNLYPPEASYRGSFQEELRQSVFGGEG